VLKSNIDITERKKAEEALRIVAENLKRSNSELEQFAYVASHDLQEPLRMVTSYTQLLEQRYKGKLDADADEFIRYAVDGANRMRWLIDDLLSYSRVNRRGNPFRLTESELALDVALKNLQMLIEENGAVVTHDQLPEVMADEGQLVQILQNLIGNAIKFHAKEPPRVHVSAHIIKKQSICFLCKITALE
jgi:light-regulated signal transduction histidine kinase (bacteriophytochrome)